MCAAGCHPLQAVPCPPCAARSPPPQIMAIAPALLPELLAILRSDEYGAALQRKALTILHTILEVLQVGRLAAAREPGGMRRRREARKRRGQGARPRPEA